jgi:endonuclease-3
VEINFEQVFKTFRRNYKLVPLEVFGDNPYKTLISTILSSRTKDEVTLKASKRLFKIAPTLKKLSKLKESQIKKLIYPVGFYRTKAKHLIKLAKTINKIPNTKEGLIKLPGVGIKTANLTLNRAFNVPAISVDTHVHKISNLLGWVKTKIPEETEKELNKILPKRYWKDINRFFVSIGRQYNSEKKLIKFFNSQGLL